MTTNNYYYYLVLLLLLLLLTFYTMYFGFVLPRVEMISVCYIKRPGRK